MKIVITAIPGAASDEPMSSLVRIVLDEDREIIVTTSGRAREVAEAAGARFDKLRSGADLDLSVFEDPFLEDEQPPAPAPEPEDIAAPADHPDTSVSASAAPNTHAPDAPEAQ
jgi:hypothetical protein